MESSFVNNAASIMLQECKPETGSSSEEILSTLKKVRKNI